MLTKLPSSQDIRNVHMPAHKARQIARVYYQNAIQAQSHLANESPRVLEGQADHMASCLVDGCFHEASQAGLVLDGKIQVTFFLLRLLKEFQLQETISLPSPSSQIRQPLQSELDPVFASVLHYCVDTKLDHIIKIMLEHHSSDARNALPAETLSLVNQHAKAEIGDFLAQLLQAAFSADESDWFALLNVEQPGDDEVELFASISEALGQVSEDSEEQLESVASLVLQVQELRTALALSVSQLLQAAKQDIELPSTKINKNRK